MKISGRVVLVDCSQSSGGRVQIAVDACGIVVTVAGLGNSEVQKFGPHLFEEVEFAMDANREIGICRKEQSQ